jgi:hypothetical protein
MLNFNPFERIDKYLEIVETWTWRNAALAPSRKLRRDGPPPPPPLPPTHLLFFLSFLTTRPNGMRRRFCGTCQNRPGASRIKKCCPPPSVSYTHAPYYRSSSSSFRGCNNNNWWQKERRGRLVRHYYTIHLNALSKNRPAPPSGPKTHTHTEREKRRHLWKY